MNEFHVELPDIAVMRQRADMNGKGPSAAFDYIESKLPTLSGRRFYGTFRETPDGEEYFACVAQTPSDDPRRLGLETGVIPGGWYVRRKLQDWESHLAELPHIFAEMAETANVDPSRPSIEFYRSRTELHLLVPVHREGPAPQRPGVGIDREVNRIGSPTRAMVSAQSPESTTTQIGAVDTSPHPRRVRSDP